jgi:hypothetical protein
MRMVFARAAVLAVSLGYLCPLAAQDGSTGAIRGTVVDPANAHVAGAGYSSSILTQLSADA